MIKAHIGVDDVDSLYGGCTTHFATLLAYKLKHEKVVFLDYLNLVRLNPAVPFKTRGNGAVAIRFAVESESKLTSVWDIAKQLLQDYVSRLQDPKCQPVITLAVGDVDERISTIAAKALHDIIPLDMAVRTAEKAGVVYYAPKGRLRGLVGALASIGYTMERADYTYELVAYRKPEYWGRPRLVDFNSVVEMDRLYRDYTILNYDPESSRVLITPRGPDPVLFGLRGEDPGILLNAFRLLRVKEPIEYLAMYRTNQHTDCHLLEVNSICEVRPYTCVRVKGEVRSKPRRRIGGHVFFELCDSECCITVAAYEPTKRFRDVVEKLYPGDIVEVLGCVRPPGPEHGLTLNLEKMRVLKTTRVIVYENPKCPLCGSRMESAGMGRGYRCRKCHYADPYASKIPVEIPRDLKPGWYQPPYSAFKHLMKPVERFGREKRFFDGVVRYDVVIKLV